MKQAAESAARSLYLSAPPGTPPAACDARIVGQLLALLDDATQADLLSLEQLLGLSLAAGHVPDGVIDILWRTFALAVPDATEKDARGAAQLLAMLASSDASIVATRLPLVSAVGLGPRWKANAPLATAAAVACRHSGDGGKKNFFLGLFLSIQCDSIVFFALAM